MTRIREIIVVEGRNDLRAVKAAVEAEVIVTSGYGISEATWERLRRAAAGPGILILTDPDHAGEAIRKRIGDRFPSARHAFLARDEATAAGDVGVENAAPEAIREALAKARCLGEERADPFSPADLDNYGLAGGPEAAARRDALGKALGIGYGNAKTFLRRLNAYGVTSEEYHRHGKALFTGDRPPTDGTDRLPGLQEPGAELPGGRQPGGQDHRGGRHWAE